MSFFGRTQSIVIIWAFLFVSFSSSFAANGTLPGNGTESDPFLIEDSSDFQTFCNDSSKWAAGIYTRLTADLDLDLQSFNRPLIAYDTDSSNDTFDGVEFSGIFDGCGHEISNIIIEGTNCGLFGQTSSECSIKNLTVKIGCIGDLFSESNVGGLVVNNYGSVNNCFSIGINANIQSSHYGALVCNNYGDITNSHASGVLEFNAEEILESYYGMLVGKNLGTISNCYSEGAISVYSNVGGLVGINSGTVNNCHSTCSCDSLYFSGGLIGQNSGHVTDCFAAGSVSAYLYAGGLIAENSGDITRCYSTSDINSIGYHAGGLIGSNWGSATISNCFAAGDVHSSGIYVGGLIGENTDSIVSNCYSTGAVGYINDDYGPGQYVGGLIGYNQNSSVNNCYAAGLVVASIYSRGLVGENNAGTISNCFWDRNTTTRFIGYAQNSDSPGTINNVTGLSTAQMQNMNTYLDSGWDFVSESVNGSDDIWRNPYQASGYPILSWQKDIHGDIAGSYGVNMADFVALSSAWLSEFQLVDLQTMAANWLAGNN